MTEVSYYRNSTYAVHVIVEYRDCSSIEGHGDVKRIRSQFTLNTISIEQPELLYMISVCLLLVYACINIIQRCIFIIFILTTGCIIMH